MQSSVLVLLAYLVVAAEALRFGAQRQQVFHYQAPKPKLFRFRSQHVVQEHEHAGVPVPEVGLSLMQTELGADARARARSRWREMARARRATAHHKAESLVALAEGGHEAPAHPDYCESEFCKSLFLQLASNFRKSTAEKAAGTEKQTADHEEHEEHEDDHEEHEDHEDHEDDDEDDEEW